MVSCWRAKEEGWQRCLGPSRNPSGFEDLLSKVSAKVETALVREFCVLLLACL